MVKPGMAYLDIVRQTKDKVPWSFYIVDYRWELFPSEISGVLITLSSPLLSSSVVQGYIMPIFSDWVPSKYSVYGNLNFWGFGVLKENLLSYYPAVNTSDIWKMFMHYDKLQQRSGHTNYQQNHKLINVVACGLVFPHVIGFSLVTQ